eukprot:5096134-Pyramimonas_sp.AAC.1
MSGACRGLGRQVLHGVEAVKYRISPMESEFSDHRGQLVALDGDSKRLRLEMDKQLGSARSVTPAPILRSVPGMPFQGKSTRASSSVAAPISCPSRTCSI